MRTGYTVYFNMRDLLNARSNVRAGYLKTCGQEWRCTTHAVQHLKASPPHHHRLGLVSSLRSLLDDSYGDAIPREFGRHRQADRTGTHDKNVAIHSDILLALKLRENAIRPHANSKANPA